MSTIIAIDPGQNTGIAVLQNGSLVQVRLLDGSALPKIQPIRCPVCPHIILWPGCPHALPEPGQLLMQMQALPKPDLVVLERPVYWRTTPNMPALMSLSLTAGGLVGSLLGMHGQGIPVLAYEPKAWKGPLPKDHHQPYILACMYSTERALLPRLPRSRYYQPDVLDAVGLALWVVGRLRNNLDNPLRFAGDVAPARPRSRKTKTKTKTKPKPLQQGALTFPRQK